MKTIEVYKHNKKSVLNMHWYQCFSVIFRLFLVSFCFVLGHFSYAQSRTDDAEVEKGMVDWGLALNEVVRVARVEENEVNVSYKFNACFLVEGECVASSEAYRDEFQKLTFFYAPGKTSVPLNHVTFYLSLKDGHAADMVMRFVYFNDDWLHLKKVAVLVDNEVVFEQEIPKEQVRKEAVAMTQVYEIGDVKMTQHLDVVEKIAQGKSVAIRMSGSNQRDAYLHKSTLNAMRLQAEEILTMYSILDQALKNKQVNVILN